MLRKEISFAQPKGWRLKWHNFKRSIWAKFRSWWWGKDWRANARSKRPETAGGIALYNNIQIHKQLQECKRVKKRQELWSKFRDTLSSSNKCVDCCGDLPATTNRSNQYSETEN